MQNESILIVGTGGIGCELLKLLYLNKTKRITLIDYDTIELTNLNRQFLFTDNDIKKYKAEVVGQAYKKMYKEAELIVLTKNIFEFDKDFFSQFQVVFNCLDNNKARKYVNDRCLITNTILVDGGSTGFLGQSVYFNFKNECFRCIPEKVSEEIPVCTIRSQPTTFEHCLIWAKEFFFEKCKERKDFKKILKNEFDFEEKTFEPESKKQKSLNNFTLFFDKPEIREIIVKTEKIYKEIIEKEELMFDKDDYSIMTLVYNVSLIRAHFFDIETKSLFESQSIIGKIIPSICTTNSLIASFMILSYFKQQNFYIFKKKKFLMTEPADKNEECLFCKFPIFILKRKKEFTFKMLFKLLNEYVKNIESVYYEDNVYFNKYLNRDVNKNIDIEHNLFFYVKGDCIVLIYNEIWNEESQLERVYN